MTRTTKNRLKKARHDVLMHIVALMPLLATMAASLQGILPELKDLLSPWAYAGIAFGASFIAGAVRLKHLAVEGGSDAE